MIEPLTKEDLDEVDRKMKDARKALREAGSAEERLAALLMAIEPTTKASEFATRNSIVAYMQSLLDLAKEAVDG